MPKLYFIFFALVVLVPAFYVLFTKKIVQAAFMLMVSFLGVAAIFVLAAADFLAVAQIMVYIGGILILLVFGVLLTQNKTKNIETFKNQIFTDNYNRILGGLSFLAVFAGLLYIQFKIPFQILDGRHFNNTNEGRSTVQKLGINLILENSLALEIVGLLLLGALVAAGFLAKKSIEK